MGCVGPEPITDETVYEDTSPAWSPDGSRIIYSHFNYKPDEASYPTGMYSIETLGNNTTLVYDGFGYSSDWAPNGIDVVFEERGNIFTLNLTNNVVTQLTFGRGNHFPSWSPDGRHIVYDMAFNDSSGIWKMDSNGDNKEKIGPGVDADWAPTGSSLVFIRGVEISPGYSRAEIFTLQLESYKIVQLTDNGKTGNSNKSPVWSPDGNTIAWVHEGEIWLMTPEGKNQRRLTVGFQPAWAPDSRKIAYSKRVHGNTSIHSIQIKGGQHRQLTH